ncbi:histidinol-phosphatase HisJ [Clostridium perfringens]|uniref:histidinol-phosphatase HisJ n=1 Tax=Clostridium perfringens TaxID=1502 RepID=UPI002A5FB061|nr:histidinol-phosphatase HisJ [Clostridium perfringens]
MILNTKRDGHVHSTYCPHGSNDSLDMYIDTALRNGITEITFTEHMPLPMEDPSPRKNSALPMERLEEYIKGITELKEKVKDKIKVNVGLEVDYVEGYEEETKAILNKYGKYLDDAILSVHIVKFEGAYYQIGNGSDMIGELVEKIGGMDKLYDLYYETMLKSIKCDLGAFKPKRIGHPTLVRKYKADFPNEKYNIKLLESILKEMKKGNYEIDLNTSGLRREKCGEVHPQGIFLDLCLKYNIPMVLGSDSHSSKYVGVEFEKVANMIFPDSEAI